MNDCINLTFEGGVLGKFAFLGMSDNFAVDDFSGVGNFVTVTIIAVAVFTQVKLFNGAAQNVKLRDC